MTRDLEEVKSLSGIWVLKIMVSVPVSQIKPRAVWTESKSKSTARLVARSDSGKALVTDE